MEPSSEASRPTEQGPSRQQQDRGPRYLAPISTTDEATEGETDPETATTHLARFEFSSDGGGTKVLMVEWQPGAAGAAVTPKPPNTGATGASDPEGWDIAWIGKSTNLPANDSDQNGSRRRVFFLLPPDASVPATVTITPTGSNGTEQHGMAEGSIEVKPLPAIFPASFDSEAGPRGVLHTLWARRRVAELEKEMDAEMRTNPESVGLEMALVEKQWIEENFLTKASQPQVIRIPDSGGGDASIMTPLSPRSPGGKLSEKLRGLRLATTPADLIPSPSANTFTHASAVTADGSDVAVSSLSAISQSNRANEIASLDAALKGNALTSNSTKTSTSRDDEDELFALPMSPRSPEMKKSPFSMLK